MTNWQRRLRAAIAVFGVGFAILVYFAIRGGRPPAAPVPPVDLTPQRSAPLLHIGDAGGLRRLLPSGEALAALVRR